MAKKKTSRFLDEASLQVLTRSQPELDALTALIRDADTQRRSALSQARSGRVAIEQGVDQILPQIQQREAALQLDRHAPTTTFGQVLNQQRGAAHADLLARRSGASVAEAAQVRQAQGAYASDIGKVRQSQLDLARRMGLETEVLRGTLSKEAATATRQATRDAANDRGRWISAGWTDDPANGGQPIPGGPADITDPRDQPKPKERTPATAFKEKYGVSLNTPTQHGTARDYVDKRLTDAQAFAKSGIPRSQASQMLVNGIPDQPVLDAQGKPVLEDAGNGTTRKKVKAGVKAQGNSLWTSIALDLAYDGRISRKNAAALHRRGYSVKGLGIPGSAPAPSRRKSKAVKRTGDTVAKAVGNVLG